jgi:hypothetical protein
MLRSRNIILPVFLAAAVSGCASMKHVESVLPAAPDNGCWSTVERVSTKGEGEKQEVVGRQIVDRTYSPECGNQRVLTEQMKAAAEVARARVDANSMLLAQGLKTVTDKAVLNNLYRQIVGRLDSENPEIQTSQAAALEKVGVTQAFVRSQVVKCRSVTLPDGKIVLDCD